jgi:hypothetical protein
MDAPDDLIITIADIRLAGMCARGARRWFEVQGLDFARLLKQGYPASVLLATGDAQAVKVVERTMKRLSNG